MDKIARCQYCGKEFIKKEEDYDDDYVCKCVMHECEHINMEAKFKNNLQEAINILNKKYNILGNYKDYILTVSVFDYGIDSLAHQFTLVINQNKCMSIIIYGEYKNFKECNTTQEIISQIEEYYEDYTERI
ncbi:hypothetical protein CLOHAE12215_01460 [Clostridium haemolyticum]|uniref:hypothetical protein n=1 Tax=Clostridium haemolyticum TaxID=84025 RepID=UPI001C39B7F4|nr:hypothetical protein [Clostridium haemolyticum]CAG7840044.1 hypothetical protein CLOHAE12215_01460 [Clostridium haemolyticum]